MTEAHHLVVVTPDNDATTCVISGDTVTLGRDPENTIRIDFEDISNSHCTIQRTGGGYSILDHGSTNGTRVNGQQIQASTELAHGDVLTIGRSIYAVYSVAVEGDKTQPMVPLRPTGDRPEKLRSEHTPIVWTEANLCEMEREEEIPPFTLSYIIPLMNERGTLTALYEAIRDQSEPIAVDWEIIFIDDGSADGSWQLIQQLAFRDPAHVTALRFRSNQGKAAGLAAGYEEASGDYVFTLDADLQDDPKEIPRFLDKIRQGYDIVTGWKQKRHDPWHKVLPSRVFNRMLSKVNGVSLHDHNCGFKCYRRDVVKQMPMYGEMHRMVPSLASMNGYRTAEIPVQHHPRTYGVSKYGVRRFLRGFMDMWSVSFIKRYRQRPLHLLGGVALPFGAAAAGSLALGVVFPQFVMSAMILCAVFGSVGVLLFALGLHASLFVHHYEQHHDSCHVAERIDRKPAKAVVGQPLVAPAKTETTAVQV